MRTRRPPPSAPPFASRRSWLRRRRRARAAWRSPRPRTRPRRRRRPRAPPTVRPGSRAEARARQFGQPALGLTDHGVMNGAIELHNACTKHGVKPIIGCEIYLVDDHSAAPNDRAERNHLTLLAADEHGYRNLVELSSAGF